MMWAWRVMRRACKIFDGNKSRGRQVVSRIWDFYEQGEKIQVP